MVCRDPAVQALQFLECIDSKDTNQKAQFFRNSLVEVLPIIPKVSQLVTFYVSKVILYFLCRNYGFKMCGQFYSVSCASKR